MIQSHVVVDGSNIATEERTTPSLRQLDDAVKAFLAEHEVQTLTVVVDATFIQPELRSRVEALAGEAGVPFHGVWLEADPEILAPRIEGREGDASDATVATLRMQLDLDVGEVAWRKVDASGPAADSAEAWVASIRG